MVWDVENSLKDAEADFAIKVVILKANGEGFCAGHDVGAGGGPAVSRVHRGHGGRAPLGRTGRHCSCGRCCTCGSSRSRRSRRYTATASAAGPTSPCCNDIVVASEDAYFQMPLPQGLGFPGGETMIEPWVMMNFHHAYEYLYLSQTVDAGKPIAWGWSTGSCPATSSTRPRSSSPNRSPRPPLGPHGHQGGREAGLGDHGHAGPSAVPSPGDGDGRRAGDVAAWRQENVDKGYGLSPRQVAARRAEAAAEAARAKRAH